MKAEDVSVSILPLISKQTPSFLACIDLVSASYPILPPQYRNVEIFSSPILILSKDSIPLKKSVVPQIFCKYLHESMQFSLLIFTGGSYRISFTIIAVAINLSPSSVALQRSLSMLLLNMEKLAAF